MDAAILTATAAVLGSLAGGSASLATAWLNQRTQGKRASVQVEIHKREVLYAEFITECAKLTLDALDHSLDKPETFQQVYTLVNRIRLISCDAVLHAAERSVEEIIAAYEAPIVPIEKLRQLRPSELHDPIKAFSEACRLELKEIHKGRD